MEQITGTIDAWRQGNQQARTGMIANRSEIGQVGAAIDQFLDDLEAGKAQRAILEERQALLNNELQHRVKNALATVSAVASQTFKDPAQRPDLETYLARVRAIADAFDMLRRSEWEGGRLREVVDKTLVMYPPERRVVEGPDMPVGPKTTLALSLAMHELATNSAKYGALLRTRRHVERHLEHGGAGHGAHLEGTGWAACAPPRKDRVRNAHGHLGAGRRSRRDRRAGLCPRRPSNAASAPASSGLQSDRSCLTRSPRLGPISSLRLALPRVASRFWNRWRAGVLTDRSGGPPTVEGIPMDRISHARMA